MCLVEDASDVGIGGCLLQIDDSRIRPLGWYSRKLTNAERSYIRWTTGLTYVLNTIIVIRFVDYIYPE